MDTTTLELFARSFAGNWRENSESIQNNSATPDPENWGFFRTTGTTPIQITNREYLKYLLGVYLRYTPKRPDAVRQAIEFHSEQQKNGLTEGFLIRAYMPDGQIANACATLYDYINMVQEFPIADPEALDKLETEIFADEWPTILQSILREFDGNSHPFTDGDCQLTISLHNLTDTAALEKLFLRHNPRNYWWSVPNVFNMRLFLYDFTDGRVSFEELFNACPDTMTPTVSAIVANTHPQRVHCEPHEMNHNTLRIA